MNNFKFFKFIISARGWHCEHSPRAPSNLAAPLIITKFKTILNCFLFAELCCTLPFRDRKNFLAYISMTKNTFISLNSKILRHPQPRDNDGIK